MSPSSTPYVSLLLMSTMKGQQMIAQGRRALLPTWETWIEFLRWFQPDEALATVGFVGMSQQTKKKISLS